LDKNKNFIFNINCNFNSKGKDVISAVNFYHNVDQSFRMFFFSKKLQITLDRRRYFFKPKKL